VGRNFHREVEVTAVFRNWGTSRSFVAIEEVAELEKASKDELVLPFEGGVGLTLLFGKTIFGVRVFSGHRANLLSSLSLAPAGGLRWSIHSSIVQGKVAQESNDTGEVCGPQDHTNREEKSQIQGRHGHSEVALLAGSQRATACGLFYLSQFRIVNLVSLNFSHTIGIGIEKDARIMSMEGARVETIDVTVIQARDLRGR